MFDEHSIYKAFRIVVVIFVLLCAGKLLYLQVIKHSFFAEKLENQSKARVVFRRDRGIIYDSAGNVLAQNRKLASLYVFGENIEDPASFLSALRQAGVEITPAVQQKILNRSTFIFIKRRMEITQAEMVKKAVPDVKVELEDARYYPEGSLFSSIIGVTNVDNIGAAGLEFHMENVLQGKVIPANIIKDSRKQLILYDDTVLRAAPESAIYLTIDVQLQAVIDRILAQDMEEYQAKRAIVLAMDVYTGAILAYSAISRDKSEQLKNFATSYLMEPGSIFKAVTFGYLIEKGLYRADHRVDVSRAEEIYGHKIKDVGSYQVISQQDVFTKSSNIGTVQLTRNVGSEAFYKYLLRCGFGQKSEVDGAYSEAGLLRPPKGWSGLSLAEISIGQELMVTPVQMIRFYGAIGNRGSAVKPTFISKIVRDGVEMPVKTESEEFLSPETANTLLSMLGVVVSSGTGKRAQSAVVAIGGKTGTGQLIDPKTKTYSVTDFVTSFAGLFPLENPRVAMIVIYDSPRHTSYGGENGAVTFKKIAEQIAFHYNLGNDRTKVEIAARKKE